MKILIIEDNDYKREKVLNYLKVTYSNVEIEEAYSFSSGLDKALNYVYDFIVLDMSLPSFDRTDVENGGRFRTYGGKEIARKIKRKGVLVPFVVLTHYTSFTDENGDITLETLATELASQNEGMFRGAIYYSSSESSWKEKLKKAISEYV